MNKTTLMLSLLCVSGSALAEFRGEFKPTNRFERHRELGERARNSHKDMNVCSEIEKKLDKAETAYDQYVERISSVNTDITNQRRKVNAKDSALRTKEAKFRSDSRIYAQLLKRQENKPELVRQNTINRDDANSLIPAAQLTYDAAKKKVRKKCKRGLGFGGFTGSCKDARKALKAADKVLKPLTTKRDNAIANLRELSQIEGKVARAERALNASTTANANEIDARPTLAKMQSRLNNMVTTRDQNNSDFQDVENKFGILGVRFEKCTNMRYEAKKAPAFRRALSVFAADNGQGCEERDQELRNARGNGRRGNSFARIAIQDGINEAYDLICESGELVRTEEVPGETIYVEAEPIEVPAQCPENGGSTNDPNQGIFVEDFFSTNDNGSAKYENNMSKSHTFKKVGASQINLKISNIDMEIGWDFLYVYNAAGEQIAKITNEAKNVPYGEYETGFIDGDTITIKVTSDNATQNTGFSVDGFFVKK